jgi:hypothetical protein
MHLQDGGRSFLIDWKQNRSSSTEEGQAPSNFFTSPASSEHEVRFGFHSKTGSPKRPDQETNARWTVETVRAIETRQRRGGFEPEQGAILIVSGESCEAIP